MKILSFFVPFGLVGYLALSCSAPPLERASMELDTCFSAAGVKTVFNKYKKNFSRINDNLEKEVDKEFLDLVSKRLSGLNLTYTEVAECKGWLPMPTSLNLIVIPDLSRRIVDELNNPGQVTHDTLVLHYIWTAFKIYTKHKLDSEHYLSVEVTDEKQANGRFSKVANNLIFDMPVHKSSRKRSHWIDTVYSRYEKNIAEMYSLAKEGAVGADYWYYFKFNLLKHIRDGGLYVNYRNVLVLITDGYLEAENSDKTGKWAYTGTFQERNEVVRRIKLGKSVEDAVRGIIEIPDIDQKFPTLEVLVLEVNRRRGCSTEEKDCGTVKDNEILKFLWRDWFRRIEIKNADREFFVLRNIATKDTEKIIKEFFLKTD